MAGTVGLQMFLDAGVARVDDISTILDDFVFRFDLL